MHVPSATGGSNADGRPTTDLSLHELFDLNSYWLAINILWGALGISLLPILIIDTVCGGDQVCGNPSPILGGFVAQKGTAEAIITTLGVLVAILVQPTVAAISDHTTTRIGRRKPFIIVGTVLDMVFLLGFYLSGAWIGLLVFYVLLQFSSNFAQGPFQGYMPDLVPARQVGLASGLMGLMILLGTGGGAILVAAATAFGNPRAAVFVIMTVELVTMLLTVTRVRDGRPGIPRNGRSWRRIALEAWGTDILHERSFIWLLGSRLFLLMATSTLVAMAFFFMQDTFQLERQEAVNLTAIAGILVILFGAIATLPSGRLSQRFGRKRMIYLAASVGFVGMAGIATSQSPTQALAFVVLVGVGGGIFLAVDWALMTDIIPKAESGRYMGISNVVTGSAGALAAAIGFVILDFGNRMAYGLGPRLAFMVACGYYVLGALLLRPVDEHRREDIPEVEPAVDQTISPAPAG